MPSLYYRVEATGINILKTVTDQVIYGLLEELDLSRSFENGVYIMSSFMASSNYSNGAGAPTMVRNRCDVDVNYIMDKSQVPWPVETPYTTSAYGRRTSNKGTYTPILIDSDAGILIEHQTVACAIELDFTLTFTTFDEACKAFDAIQSRYRGSLIQTPFHLAFSYPVSFEMLKFLSTVHAAKTKYKNKSLTDYINDTKQTQISFDVRKTQLTDPNADVELMIRCQQLNCLMQLTMDQKEPDVSRIEQLPDAYKLSFNAVIQFGRPSVVVINTPVSVDNTPLPAELFSSVNFNSHYNSAVAGVYQDLTCNEFMRRSYGDFNAAHQLVRLPEYDDWLSLDDQYRFHQYRPFLISHFTLDGPITTFNLDDLPDVKLHPVVQEIMKKTGSAIFNYGGLFNIGVYANDLRLSNALVNIDSDLNITIKSNRLDKVYHLVISETTELSKTDAMWDELLIKYRYFFPMTIERNIKSLVDKRYFSIAYEDSFLSLISKLSKQGRIKTLLTELISLDEVTNEIYQYTQNPTQLADFLVYTSSTRKGYKLTEEVSEGAQCVRDYYATDASVTSRSLFVAFIELCLYRGYLTLDEVPTQYLDPNRTVYPYYVGQGGFYGFNTPLRIFNYTIQA